MSAALACVHIDEGGRPCTQMKCRPQADFLIAVEHLILRNLLGNIFFNLLSLLLDLRVICPLGLNLRQNVLFVDGQFFNLVTPKLSAYCQYYFAWAEQYYFAWAEVEQSKWTANGHAHDGYLCLQLLLLLRCQTDPF